MGVMLEDELRLAKLRQRLEDRPNHKSVTVRTGAMWPQTCFEKICAKF